MEHFLVIGLGRFGSSVAKTLYEAGKDVLGIDISEVNVQDLVDNHGANNAVIADATDIKVLKDIGVEHFEVAFVCMREIEPSILVTANLSELGLKTIIAKASSKKHGRILTALGATQIVYPEEYMGKKIAELTMDRNLIEHLKFNEDFMLIEIPAPSEFIDKNIRELDFRNKYNANIVGIKKLNGEFIANPLASTVINESDILLIITDNESAKKISKIK